MSSIVYAVNYGLINEVNELVQGILGSLALRDRQYLPR